MTTQVVIKEQLFRGVARPVPLDLTDCPTITQIAATITDAPPRFMATCECRINGHLIPRENWSRTRPKNIPGVDTVVSFTRPMMGDSGVRIAAQIALLIVATLVFGPGGTLGLTGIYAAAAVAVAVAAGSYAISAIMPPPSFGAPPLTSVGNSKTGVDTRQPASLNGNVLAKGSPVPRVVGTFRTYPPWVTQPLIEIIGRNQSVECVGILAGPHAMDDVMVGEALADTIDAVQYEVSEGLAGAVAPTLVTRQSYTDTNAGQLMVAYALDDDTGRQLEDQAVQANSLPTWASFTTRDAPDEFWIPIECRGGFANTDEDAMFVPIRIQMRQVGTSTWIKLPECHISLRRNGPWQGTIKLMWKADITRVNPPASGGFRRAYSVVPAQVTTPTTGGWACNTFFRGGPGSDIVLRRGNRLTTRLSNLNIYEDRIEYYLSGATFPKSGAWEVQVMRGQCLRETSFTELTYKYEHSGPGDPQEYDFFGYNDEFVPATSPVEYISKTLVDQKKFSDDIQILRVSSIWNENPIPDPSKFAWVALKARNLSVSDLSVLASGYVNDYSAGNWNNLITTSNPAPHFRDVLVGDLSADPISTDAVDDTTLVAWRTQCINMGYTVNVVLEGKTAYEALQIIAATGYGRPAHNEKWGVAYDRDRAGNIPVQIFSPRNMTNFSWVRPLYKLPTGIRARWNDASKNYKPAPDEVIFNSGSDITHLEQYNYDALVTLADVTDRAIYDLRSGIYRGTFYDGTVDIEAIICTKNDLVGVQHDILSSSAGFSRIKTVVTSGANITGLILEGTIPGLGVTTGITMRYKDGTGILTKQIVLAAADTHSDTVVFSAPFADPGAAKLDTGCLVVSGALNSEYKRLIVTAIVPSEDGTAKISFVDEAPEIWA
jgi:hypothetical protein